MLKLDSVSNFTEREIIYMTEENYQYRTNPMFLRNQFGTDMPMLQRISLKDDEKEGLRLIGFDVAKTERDTHFNRFVHFFLYDYKFEDIWNNPDKYIEKLSQYKAVLTPTSVPTNT